MNIIFIILLLIIFILMIPLKISLTYDSETNNLYSLSLEIIFIKLKLNLNNKKYIKKKLFNKNCKSNKKNIIHYKNNKKHNLISKLKNIDINQYYLLIKKTLNISCWAIKKLCKYIKIENIKLYHIIIGKDAADIGFKYSQFNIIICNIYSILYQIFNINQSRIYIYPDFVNNKPQTYFFIKLKFRLITIIIILLFICSKFGLTIYKVLKSKNINKD